MTDKHDKHHKHGHKQDQKKVHQHKNKYADKIQNPTDPVLDVISQKNHGEFSAHQDKPTADKHKYDRREDEKHKK